MNMSHDHMKNKFLFYKKNFKNFTAGFENEFQKSDQSPFDQYLIFFNDSLCKHHHITCTFLNLTTSN